MTIDYHICMMGASRVGKTTLLASIIEDFHNFSNDYYVGKEHHFEVKAIGSTYRRIKEKISDLETYCKAGQFSPDLVPGTQDEEEFVIGISHKEIKQKLINPTVTLHFHDFKGGKLKDGTVDEVPFKKSEIFIMPIDATLLMESISTEERAAAKKRLAIAELRDVLKTWAQLRAQDKNGLFILAPVKCESYFKDNQDLPMCKNDSAKLYEKVMDSDFYGNLVDIIRENELKCLEKKNEKNTYIHGYYMPVDTIGCCALYRQEWERDEKTDELVLKTRFEIPHGCQWSPFGGRQIMMEILEYLAKQERKKEGFFSWVGKLIRLRSDFNNEVILLSGKLKTTCKYDRAKILKKTEII